jgi:hypothetical protein
MYRLLPLRLQIYIAVRDPASKINWRSPSFSPFPPVGPPRSPEGRLESCPVARLVFLAYCLKGVVKGSVPSIATLLTVSDSQRGQARQGFALHLPRKLSLPAPKVKPLARQPLARYPLNGADTAGEASWGVQTLISSGQSSSSSEPPHPPRSSVTSHESPNFDSS